MPKHLIAAIALLLTLSACQSNSAFKYSQDIVAKENSLVDDITKTENAVDRYMDDNEYDSIAAVSERMESLGNDKLEEIKTTKAPAVKEGENFKAAAIRYFQFMKSLYTNYKNYGRAGSDEERDQILEKMLQIVDKKDEAIEDMQSAQRKFAEANGFRLQK